VCDDNSSSEEDIETKNESSDSLIEVSINHQDTLYVTWLSIVFLFVIGRMSDT